MRSILLLLVALRSLHAQGGCATIASPSAWFSFEEPAFREARPYAPAVAPGLVGKALRFDGKTTYWAVPPATPGVNVGTGDFSIEMWLRTTQSSTRNIIDKRDAVPVGYAAFIHLGYPGFQVTNGTHGNYWTRDISVSDGKWHHIAVAAKRLPPSAPTVYVDGVARTTNSSGEITLADLDVPDSLWVGRHHANGRVQRDNIYYEGDLDELTFYPRALTPKEILSIYRAGAKGKCRSK